MSRILNLIIFIQLALVAVSLIEGVSVIGDPFYRYRYPYSNRYISNRQFGGYPGYPGNRPYPPIGGGGCPVCDSSVFGYCSHRLEHDSCCCGDPLYTDNFYDCQYKDCNFLHANSCEESALIATCCCEDPYRRSFNPRRVFNKK